MGPAREHVLQGAGPGGRARARATTHTLGIESALETAVTSGGGLETDGHYDTQWFRKLGSFSLVYRSLNQGLSVPEEVCVIRSAALVASSAARR